ncbi:hypothetical protein C8R44DRAFT_894032 [Mycena epipterygia]|nr:hypothetical protein C8R44DRAFT_894032 [Mycena epipterygia]
MSFGHALETPDIAPLAASITSLPPIARGPDIPSSSSAHTPIFSLSNDDMRWDPRRIAESSLPAKRARKPRTGNELAPSIYRPQVPADRRVLLWTSPHSFHLRDRLSEARIRLDLQARIYEGLLRATTEQTRETYGAGMLRYHQFCDRERIGENARMPADRLLLAAFIAEAVGTCSGKCLRNWLNGLRLWHLFNDAEWHGDEGWLPSLKKAGDRAGVPFKRAPRGPITKAHLRALRAYLDVTTGFGAAAWSAACTGYWGCRRMGELVIKSAEKFLLEHDTCRDTRTSYGVVNEHEVVDFHIVWTKTTNILGATCILTQVKGPDADLCPTWAYKNHLAVNYSPPPLTPLFAFREHGTWRPLTKDHFLRTTSAAYNTAQLATVFGHSYRIGGSVELLLAGVEPEIIMKLGGWTSLCFLIYWRRLEQILPDRITSAWASRFKHFASSHGLPHDSGSLNFDGDDN